MNVAVLLFDGAEELDFCGPFEVFGIAGKTFTIAPQREVRGSNGLRLLADYTYADAPQPDVLVVPGGPIVRHDPGSLAGTVAFIQRTAPACKMVLSVCTGAFLLARAGLLDGRACTTHYMARHKLMANFPKVQVRYARAVADGKIVTTAGVTAGIDGALYVIARLRSFAAASQVAAQIEYPWQPAAIERATTNVESLEEYSRAAMGGLSYS